MIDVSQMITRTGLEQASVRYANERTDFIADEVFTPIYVNKRQTKVYQYDTSNMREVITEKDTKAEADKVDYTVATASRDLVPHKLSGEIDPADEADADIVVANITQDVSETVMERLLIRRERLMATLALTASNYPAANTATLAAGSTWLDAGGDPEGNSATARTATKNSSTKLPNAAAMSWDTVEKLRSAPYFIDRMKYTSATVPSVDKFKEMLRDWMGVQFLHVCGAQSNTNVEGNSTQTLGNIWDDSILFYVKNPTPSPRQVRYGAMYLRNQLYTYQYEDVKRGGPDGRIKVLEMGWWYLLAPFAVVTPGSDDDFTGGYLLKNVV